MPSALTPKGASSQQAILQAAYRLFLDQGYHATSVRDISRACGLTIGGLYNHFSGKEEIFTGVLAAYNPFVQILPEMAAASGESIDALLHDLARRMVTALGSQREALNLLFIEIVEFQGRHFEDLFPEVFPKVVSLVQRLPDAKGELRPLPFPILARSFFGLFFSYFMTQVIMPGQMAADDQALDTFVNIYLYGILTHKETP